MVVQPTYPLTSGLSSPQLRSAVTLALNSLEGLPFPKEWVDRDLMREKGWPGLMDALLMVHNPQEKVTDGIGRAMFVAEHADADAGGHAWFDM